MADACCRCASVSTASSAAACLAECAYAVWPQAYPVALLDSARFAFEAWYAQDRSEVRHHLSYSGGGSLRGRRVPVGLPAPGQLLSAADTDGLLFAPGVAAAVASAFDWAVLLDFATFLHTAPGSPDQPWHADSTIQGIKVQVPLVDVPEEQGPIEVRPARHAAGCETVRATSRKGTAILYLQSAQHRGTANRAATNRSVLDLSFMRPADAAARGFMAQFGRAAVAALAQHRERFAALCEAHGLRCAGAAELEALPAGGGYARVPEALPEPEGWVGAYRGDGVGVGRHVDPNGSVYEGECREGARHGHGRYDYANGASYEGGFVDDARHGRGRLVLAGGAVYEGEWAADQQHGQGRAEYPDGAVYEGGFAAGRREGHGRHVSAAGDVYEGEWRANRQHGRGRHTFASGHVAHDGEWEEGRVRPNEHTRLRDPGAKDGLTEV